MLIDSLLNSSVYRFCFAVLQLYSNVRDLYPCFRQRKQTCFCGKRAGGAGRAGNLLVSELYADEGCWSGYPPHKHDTDQPGETAHQELYHWRFDPPTGFGAQLWYTAHGDASAYTTRQGDTFAFSTGYHPTVTSPYHRSYIFTILVGKTQRSLIQNFDSTYRHLMDRIPGIAAMREKFK